MATLRYTRNLFLRCMCIIYMFAFGSFYIQIPGLYGTNGILPARTQLTFRGADSIPARMKVKPTLLWFAPLLGLNVEYMMDILALSGTFIAFLGFVKQSFCTAPVFAGLWVLYYSLFQVGQIFMEYQWDALLLEAGILAVVMAPWWSKRAKQGSPTDALSLFLVRWLFFRLMFSSGIVKLTSGCPTWWGLSALDVHFESQCLPTPFAWYAHHLPAWFLRLVTAFSIVAETFVPFLFFIPLREIQRFAFAIQVFLQVCIILTGNYNFFNLLTITLSLSLLDDEFFGFGNQKSLFRRFFSKAVSLISFLSLIYILVAFFNLRLTADGLIETSIGFTPSQFDTTLGKVVPITVYLGLGGLVYAATSSLIDAVLTTNSLGKKVFSVVCVLVYSGVAGFLFGISVVPYSTLHPAANSTVAPQLRQWYTQTQHLHLVDAYGLFRRMTGVEGRPEVIIEGSDSIEGPWQEYHFLYKPGNVNSTLPFVAPYQPRLDWQMWFAALGTYHQNPWLMSLTYRLLSGQEEVLRLLDTSRNPFPNKPPRYIKASLYHYHYTNWEQRMSPSWWTRQKVGEYFPIFSRDHPPLLDYLSSMKVLSSGVKDEEPNSYIKFGLDAIRSFVVVLEPSILLLSLFITGCVLITTILSEPSYRNKSQPKKKRS